MKPTNTQEPQQTSPSSMPAPRGIPRSAWQTFARRFVIVSLIATALAILSAPLFLYVGEIPLFAVLLINLILLPIFFVKKLLSGGYKVMGICILVPTILILAGILFIFLTASSTPGVLQVSN